MINLSDNSVFTGVDTFQRDEDYLRIRRNMGGPGSLLPRAFLYSCVFIRRQEMSERPKDASAHRVQAVSWIRK